MEFFDLLTAALLFGPDWAGGFCADAVVAANNPMQTKKVSVSSIALVIGPGSGELLGGPAAIPRTRR